MNDNNMGNQQPSLSEIEFGWLCGLIDGEGCIYICSRGGERTDYKPGMRIAMCCHDTIEHTSSLLKKIDVPHHITARAGSQKTNRSPSWAITIEGHKRMLKILPVVAPHLVTKKQQAAVVWQFCKERNAGWHRAPYSENQLALLDVARVMNQRGYQKEGSTTIRKE